MLHKILVNFVARLFFLWKGPQLGPLGPLGPYPPYRFLLGPLGPLGPYPAYGGPCRGSFFFGLKLSDFCKFPAIFIL